MHRFTGINGSLSHKQRVDSSGIDMNRKKAQSVLNYFRRPCLVEEQISAPNCLPFLVMAYFIGRCEICLVLCTIVI